VHLATRRGNRSLLQGMTSNGVTWMFWYNSFTTLLIFFAIIVQISIVAYAKIHVGAIRATVRDLSFHWGNTVRCYF
jgi:ABC-type polysaccharide/polyol phosphate export permease